MSSTDLSLEIARDESGEIVQEEDLMSLPEEDKVIIKLEKTYEFDERCEVIEEENSDQIEAELEENAGDHHSENTLEEELEQQDEVHEADNELGGQQEEGYIEENCPEVEQMKEGHKPISEPIVLETAGQITRMTVNDEEGLPKPEDRIIVSRLAKKLAEPKEETSPSEAVSKKPLDFPDFEEIAAAKSLENQDPVQEDSRDPNVVKCGEPDEHDWAKKNIKSGKKVNDLIARFNTGAFQGDAGEGSTYKSDYGVGKGQGQLRQSVFH
uniref:Uncharacterized protein n=1 Tax=Rhabditophanes sp. KR3021 TaxID=114890 RepID=A0AC35TNW4_9BILA